MDLEDAILPILFMLSRMLLVTRGLDAPPTNKYLSCLKSILLQSIWLMNHLSIDCLGLDQKS